MTPEERLELREAGRVHREQEQEFINKALDVLSGEQRSRLDQLHLQQQGSEALMRSDIADALKLTHAQIDQLKELQRVLATPEDLTPPPFTPAELAKRAEAFGRRRAKFNQDAEKVLTEEQRAAWNNLLGKRFEFKATARPIAANPPPPAPAPEPETPK